MILFESIRIAVSLYYIPLDTSATEGECEKYKGGSGSARYRSERIDLDFRSHESRECGGEMAETSAKGNVVTRHIRNEEVSIDIEGAGIPLRRWPCDFDPSSLALPSITSKFRTYTFWCS